MEITQLEWDDLTCGVSQDYLDRGFSLVDGAAPWLYVQTGDNLRLVVAESWLCEKVGWMCTDIDLSFEEIVFKMLSVSRENDLIEEQEEEKRDLIASLQKLIKKIESF